MKLRLVEENVGIGGYVEEENLLKRDEEFGVDVRSRVMVGCEGDGESELCK